MYTLVFTKQFAYVMLALVLLIAAKAIAMHTDRRIMNERRELADWQRELERRAQSVRELELDSTCKRSK